MLGFQERIGAATCHYPYIFHVYTIKPEMGIKTRFSVVFLKIRRLEFHKSFILGWIQRSLKSKLSREPVPFTCLNCRLSSSTSSFVLWIPPQHTEVLPNGPDLA